MESSIAFPLNVLVFFASLQIMMVNFDNSAFATAHLECNYPHYKLLNVQLAMEGFTKPKKQYLIDVKRIEECTIEIEMAKFENEMANGAFLNDYIYCTATTSMRTETSEKSSTTIGTTSPAASTTALAANPIMCGGPKWAHVQPAKIFDNKKGDRFVEDYALRAGFIEYIPNTFNELHIKETINNLMKNSTEIFKKDNKIGAELVKWTNKNAAWLQNIKHGAFQYFPIANEFAREGDIMMLLFECSFGKFILGPVKLEINYIQTNQKFDWTTDFDHLQSCEEQQEDITSEQIKVEDRIYLVASSVRKFLQLNLKFDVGIYNAPQFDYAKCEAFKYKYGYTNPLRMQTLNESADDWHRPRYTGRLLLPIDDACRRMHRFALSADFHVIGRIYMVRVGVAVFDPKSNRSDRIRCLITKGNYRERLCKPFTECTLFQIVYKCDQFSVRIPRLDSRANFTINGTNHFLYDEVKKYELTNPYYHKSMCVGPYYDYIIYDNDDDSC